MGSHETLETLPDGELAAFLDRLGAAWPDWDASVAPPTPEGTVELALRREDEVAIVRVHRGDVDERPVEEAAALARERALSFVVLACTGEPTEGARAAARENGVELYDGTELVSLARESGVRLPGDVGDLTAFLEERVGGYPPGLADRAAEVVRVVDDLADFDRQAGYGDASTTLDLSLGGRRVARIRFGPTSVLVYADGDDLETVATLTAHRERQPSVAELGVVEAVEEAIDRAVGEQ